MNTINMYLPDNYGPGNQPLLYDWSDNSADTFLGKWKGIGWDWKSEGLDRRSPIKGVTYYAVKTYSGWATAIQADLKKAGFNIRLHKDKDDFNDWLENAKRDAVGYGQQDIARELRDWDNDRNYRRLRYLYKFHKSKFSEWDDKFVKSVGQQLADGRTLSDKQKHHVARLLTQHKVGYESSAAARLAYYLSMSGEPLNVTYVAIKFSPATIRNIFEYAKSIEHKLPKGCELIEPDEYHTTVIYSKKHFEYQPDPGFTPKKNLSKPFLELLGKPEDDFRVLTIRYNSPYLLQRFKACLDMGGTSDFPDYKAHITIAKLVPPDFDVSSLPFYEGPIEIIEEYSEPLKEEWTGYKE